MRDLQALVDAADDAALLVAVDGLCASRQWDALADLARRCRDAVEVGKQLWGVAMHIDYRLAWEGPPTHAAATLVPGAGRFALGPLTEVAASTHTWDELAPHLTHPVTARQVAQERVIRGESLVGRLPTDAGEPPLAPTSWEPRYALPRYSDRTARFPAPEAAGELTGPVRELGAGKPVATDPGARALAEAVDAWTAESTGEAAVVTVEGPLEAAVGALADRAVLREISAREALALLQWAGASGGSRGRRRGGAAGRFAAWWTATQLAGLSWPDNIDESAGFATALGEALDELRWVRWRRDEREQGWFLRLAVADPLDGLAWAVEATDAVEEHAAAGPGQP
jgi:hypothetical protein